MALPDKAGAKALLEKACADLRAGTVQELNLNDKAVGPDGARALAGALLQNESLAIIFLRNNAIGLGGALALAEALQQNSSLTDLGIGGNAIGNDGARALAQALQQNNSLKKLWIWRNHLGDDSARALAEALRLNSSLTVLNMKNNSISDSGALALAEAMQENGSLTTLNLEKNGVSAKWLEEIAQRLEENKTEVGEEKRKRTLARIEEERAAAAHAARRSAQKKYVRTTVEEEEALAAAHAAVATTREVLAYFREGHWTAAVDGTAAAAHVDDLVTAEATYQQCQQAIGEADSEGALQTAVSERNEAKERLIAAAADAEEDGGTLFRLHAELAHRQAEVACTLTRLGEGQADVQVKEGEESKDDAEEELPSEEALLGLEGLTEETNTAGAAAQQALAAARRLRLSRVEEWGKTRTSDEAEVAERMEERMALVEQLEALNGLRQQLRTAAATAHTSAVRNCRRQLKDLTRHLVEVRDRQHTLGKLLAIAQPLAHLQCPSTEGLEEAVAKEKKAQRRQKLAKKKLAAAVIEKEILEDEGDEEEAEEVEEALREVAAREAAVVTAKEQTRAASVVVHEQAVVLLQAARWFPELLHRSVQLAELQEAGGLALGRCLEDYTVERRLAGGGGGKEGRHEVLLCRRKVNEEEEEEEDLCVLKRYVLAGGAAAAGRRRLLREVALLQRARHPFVAEVRAVFFAPDSSAAYVELAHYGGGDLAQWLAAAPRGEAAVARLLRQALLGLAAVHAAGVVHGDVKAANLFVTADGSRCVVGDFDAARAANIATTLTVTQLGRTEAFLAPELLVPGTVATTASDVFSMGLVAFDSLFPCEEGGPERRPSAAARLQGTELVVPAHRHEGLRELLAQMLSLKPEERPSAAEALAHPFFRLAMADEEEAAADGRLWGSSRKCAVEAECLEREEGVGDLTLAEGLDCSERQHFVCAADLAAYVAAFCSPDNGARQVKAAGDIACFARDCKGQFATHELAQQLQPDTFDAVMAMQRRLVERQVSHEQEDLYRRRLDDEVARLAQEGTVGTHRRRIQEELLLLRCPRCKAPFLDFSGCFALQCNRCPCNFCAVCLRDCGRNAHPHVAICPEKAVQGYGSPADFEEAQRRRRRRLVQEYLADLPLDTRDAVEAAVQADLTALGIVAL